MIKVTRDSKGIHIFLDRARVPVRKTKDAGHMPGASGTQRGIPAKGSEALRKMHGAIRGHIETCDCAMCKGRRALDRKTVGDSNYSGGGAKFKAAKSELGALGITLKNNAEWQEYIVNGLYHTDDIDDALETGKAMKKRGTVAIKRSNYDASIKAPPAKVSKTNSSAQAREIAEKLKSAKDSKSDIAAKIKQLKEDISELSDATVNSKRAELLKAELAKAQIAYTSAKDKKPCGCKH